MPAVNFASSRPLRLGVAAFGTDGARSGIGSYLRQWLEALDSDRENVAIDVMAPESEMTELVPSTLVGRRSSTRDGLKSPMKSMLWHQGALPLAARRRGWDVAFLPAANRRLAAWMPCPSVGTVHDLSMARVKEKYDRVHTAYFHTLLPALIRRLSRIITVSECSKRDIVELAQVDPARIDVIPHGVNERRFHPLDDPESERIRHGLGLTSPYLLYVARLEHPGKNHVALIRAFDRVKTRLGGPHQLVLAGAPWNGAEVVHSAARAARHAADIVFTGFTADASLPALYRGALGYVFPSLYEGFGMPLLEAMASGVPIACSNTSSLPEVAGDAALYFDPAAAESIEVALESLMSDPVCRARLIDRGRRRASQFTWRDSVTRTLAVFRRAVEEAA